VLTEKVPARILNSVYKQPLKETRANIKKGETLGEEALRRGDKAGTDEALYNQAVKQINETENLLQQQLMGSKNRVSLKQVEKDLKPYLDELEQSADPAHQAIINRIAQLRKVNGNSIPVAKANEIKRSIYNEMRPAYGKEAAAGAEGIKKIARSFKDQIAKGNDDINTLNKDLSFYGRKADVMIDKAARGGRNDMLGLGNTTSLIAGVAGIPVTGGASLAIPAIKMLGGTTLGKTLTANTLSKSGRVLDTLPSIPQKATTVAGQVAVRTPGLIGEQSPNTTNQNANNQQNDPAHNLLPPTDTIPQQGARDNRLSEQNPYPWENYRADVQRDPKNKAYYKEEYEHYKERFGGEGDKETLTAGQLKEISDIKVSINQLDTLSGYLDDNKGILGPIKGQAAKIPYSTTSVVFESRMRAVAQSVGKALEGGVLRKEDEIKYRKMLPNVTDTYEVALGKAAAVRELLIAQETIKEQIYNEYNVTGDYLPNIDQTATYE